MSLDIRRITNCDLYRGHEMTGNVLMSEWAPAMRKLPAVEFLLLQSGDQQCPSISLEMEHMEWVITMPSLR